MPPATILLVGPHKESELLETTAEKEIVALRRYIENPGHGNYEVTKQIRRTVESMEKAVASCRHTLHQLEISAGMLHTFERTLLTFRPEGGVR